VLTQGQVAEVTAKDVSLKGGRLLESNLTVWTAGVKGNSLGDILARHLGVSARRDGRIEVDGHCRPTGTSYPNIFVVGDLAARNEKGSTLPMVAPVAMQMGRHVAALLKDPDRPELKYRDKGSMATIGRSDAVVWVGKIRISGLIAWLAWLGLHLAYLLGGRNRLQVVIDWGWNYLTYDRTARQILR
jgi:NADH dehydrogenase